MCAGWPAACAGRGRGAPRGAERSRAGAELGVGRERKVLKRWIFVWSGRPLCGPGGLWVGQGDLWVAVGRPLCRSGRPWGGSRRPLCRRGEALMSIQGAFGWVKEAFVSVKETFVSGQGDLCVGQGDLWGARESFFSGERKASGGGPDVRTVREVRRAPFLRGAWWLGAAGAWLGEPRQASGEPIVDGRHRSALVFGDDRDGDAQEGTGVEHPARTRGRWPPMVRGAAPRQGAACRAGTPTRPRAPGAPRRRRGSRLVAGGLLLEVPQRVAVCQGVGPASGDPQVATGYDASRGRHAVGRPPGGQLARSVRVGQECDQKLLHDVGHVPGGHANAKGPRPARESDRPPGRGPPNGGESGRQGGSEGEGRNFTLVSRPGVRGSARGEKGSVVSTTGL